MAEQTVRNYAQALLNSISQEELDAAQTVQNDSAVNTAVQVWDIWNAAGDIYKTARASVPIPLDDLFFWQEVESQDHEALLFFFGFPEDTEKVLLHLKVETNSPTIHVARQLI